MSQPDTKQRILDAAEQLFSREGFHNASLRAITAAAGVNLAAVNYHFGGKEALIDAIFERRLTPLNAARRKRLQAEQEAARREGRRPRAEAVLRAFIEPTLAFRDSSQGARDFITLVGRALSEPQGLMRETFIRHMQPLLHTMTGMMGAALPHLPPQAVFWRLFFALAATGQTVCLLDKPLPWPDGVAPLNRSDDLLAQIVPFLTAGMEAAP